MIMQMHIEREYPVSVLSVQALTVSLVSEDIIPLCLFRKKGELYVVCQMSQHKLYVVCQMSQHKLYIVCQMSQHNTQLPPCP